MSGMFDKLNAKLSRGGSKETASAGEASPPPSPGSDRSRFSLSSMTRRFGSTPATPPDSPPDSPPETPVSESPPQAKPLLARRPTEQAVVNELKDKFAGTKTEEAAPARPARATTLPEGRRFSTSSMSAQPPVRGGFGHIKHMGDFLHSTGAMETSQRKKIFNEGFQDRKDWSAYMNKHLKGGSVTAQLSKPAGEWTHETFQAMFMSAWMSHPTEKGSYTIALTPEQAANVEKAIGKDGANLEKRKSSHFSGAGFSASKGSTPFKGYGEMLVQFEHVEGKPVLFLKMEGHKTDLKGIVAHGYSWYNKVKTGAGVTANKDLKALAEAAPGLIEPRAAENYTNSYKKLLGDLGLQDKGNLKELNLSKKMVPAREMLAHLLVKSNYDFLHPEVKNFDLENATNEQVGRMLESYISAAKDQATGSTYRLQGKVTDQTLHDLHDLAHSLIADGDEHRGRVHREVVRSPADLDLAHEKMMGSDTTPNAAGELITSGNSLTRSSALRRGSKNGPSPTPAYPSDNPRGRRTSV